MSGCISKLLPGTKIGSHFRNIQNFDYICSAMGKREENCFCICFQIFLKEPCIQNRSKKKNFVLELFLQNLSPCQRDERIGLDF